MCHGPQPPHHLHLQFFRLVCFSNFLINGKALHLTGLCLIWFWGHHLQLQSHPPLFHNFWQLNVRVATTHHPIIQKEVDELLAKGPSEPSSGGAGFYSGMFVVPKHTGGLWPMLNLRCFNCYMHVPSFKMPTIRDMSGSLFSIMIMLSPLIYRMLIYIFLLLSIIIVSYDFLAQMCLISGRFCLLGWLQPLRFSLP